eukprot:3184162-Rhodomonas_salina.2
MVAVRARRAGKSDPRDSECTVLARTGRLCSRTCQEGKDTRRGGWLHSGSSVRGRRPHSRSAAHQGTRTPLCKASILRRLRDPCSGNMCLGGSRTPTGLQFRSGSSVQGSSWTGSMFLPGTDTVLETPWHPDSNAQERRTMKGRPSRSQRTPTLECTLGIARSWPPLGAD